MSEAQRRRELAEPIGMRWRWKGGEGPWFYCSWSPDGPHKYRAPPTEVEPLYGPDLATRLAEALEEVERLKAALLEGERALDLSQSLLEQSTHHPAILAAYKAVRAAREGASNG